MNRYRRAAIDQGDLWLVILMTVAAAASVAFDLPVIVRSVFAAPLVLFLPGYAFVSALFPSMDISTVERVLLSLGTSIALTIMTGLILAGLRIPLAPESWTVSLAAITVAGVGAAYLRRFHRGIVGPRLSIARMPWIGALTVAVAALIAVNAVVGSSFIAREQESPAPEALWIVPIADHPTDARLGVRASGVAGAYSIVLSSNGAEIQRFDLQLKAEETWERIVSFTPALRQTTIVARLYEGTSTTESRFVVLQPKTDAV